MSLIEWNKEAVTLIGLYPGLAQETVGTTPTPGLAPDRRLVWPRPTQPDLEVTIQPPTTSGPGFLITKVCTQARLTRQELGQLLGVSRRAITGWLSGEKPDARHFSLLRRISELTDELARGEPDRAHTLLHPRYGHPNLTVILQTLEVQGVQQALTFLTQPLSSPLVAPSEVASRIQPDQMEALMAALPAVPSSLPPDQPASAPPVGRPPFTRRTVPTRQQDADGLSVTRTREEGQ
jgi:transcriptional regulator with XRE-family HTH domain